MILARWLSVIATLAATLSVASCTQTSSGTPMPDDTVTSGGESETANPTASAERPRDIDLDGKDPCGQIPQSDWAKFGIEHEGVRSEEPNFKSPSCYYSRVGDVTLVVTEGIGAWQARTHNVDISDADSIEEFPTITMWNKADEHSCYTAVDVADGQYLLITATSAKANVDRVETCDRSYQLAESAMKTLVAS